MTTATMAAIAVDLPNLAKDNQGGLKQVSAGQPKPTLADQEEPNRCCHVLPGRQPLHQGRFTAAKYGWPRRVPVQASILHTGDMP